MDDSVVKQFGKQGYFFDAIENCINTYNRNLSFIGVRAYESKRRMKAVKAHGMTLLLMYLHSVIYAIHLHGIN